jgi:hypothetical protein
VPLNECNGDFSPTIRGGPETAPLPSADFGVLGRIRREFAGARLRKFHAGCLRSLEKLTRQSFVLSPPRRFTCVEITLVFCSDSDKKSVSITFWSPDLLRYVWLPIK